MREDVPGDWMVVSPIPEVQVMYVEQLPANVALGHEAGDLPGLIDRFTVAQRALDLETIAGQLGASGDHRAVRPLLARLCDHEVQGEGHVEDSVCRALVALDVMRGCGTCSFAMRPRHLLAPDVVEMITELGPAVPMRYLIARGV